MSSFTSSFGILTSFGLFNVYMCVCMHIFEGEMLASVHVALVTQIWLSTKQILTVYCIFVFVFCDLCGWTL